MTIRPCPACGRPYDTSFIPPPRVPIGISCACCCQDLYTLGQKIALANAMRDAAAGFPTEGGAA